jgi:hypothetical protein
MVGLPPQITHCDLECAMAYEHGMKEVSRIHITANVDAHCNCPTDDMRCLETNIVVVALCCKIPVSL